MTKWLYNEQAEDGVGNIVKEITEPEILATYYPWWVQQMKRVKREHLISEENCIEDFATIHWAWKVEE
jgi:hypothetical protein